MAQQRGLLYPISGRIGDKIYCIRNGVSYIRSLPKKTTKAPTEKQLIHRAKFSLVMGFLFPIISILNESYRRINPKKSGTKMAFNQIFREALIGEYPDMEIDYSKVSLIRGGLRCPMGNAKYVAGTNELDFNWSSGRWDCIPNDQLIVLIYSSQQNEFWYNLDMGVYREQEFCSIPVPRDFIGHEIHVWLGCQSVDKRSYSDTVYMGKIQTQKNNDHEDF